MAQVELPCRVFYTRILAPTVDNCNSNRSAGIQVESVMDMASLVGCSVIGSCNLDTANDARVVDFSFDSREDFAYGW